MSICGYCGRDVPDSEWDGLYTSCHGCAFCSSLEHFDPCHHGECRGAKRLGWFFPLWYRERDVLHHEFPPWPKVQLDAFTPPEDTPR